MRIAILMALCFTAVASAQAPSPELVRAVSERVREVCPHGGVNIGDVADKRSWVVNVRPGATDEQLSNAAAIITTWAVETPSQETLRAQLRQTAQEIATWTSVLDRNPGLPQAAVDAIKAWRQPLLDREAKLLGQLVR